MPYVSQTRVYLPEDEDLGIRGSEPSPAPVNPTSIPDNSGAPSSPAPAPAPTSAPDYSTDVPSRPPGNTQSGGRVYIPETDQPGTPGSSGNTPSPPVPTKPTTPPKPRQGDGVSKDLSTGRRANNFRAKRASTAKLAQSSGRARYGGKVKKPTVKARSGQRAAKRTRRR